MNEHLIFYSLCCCVCIQTYTLRCSDVNGAGDERQTLVHADLQVHHPEAQRTNINFHNHICHFESQQILYRCTAGSKKSRKPDQGDSERHECQKQPRYISLTFFTQRCLVVWKMPCRPQLAATQSSAGCWLTFVEVSCLVSQTFDKNSFQNAQHSCRGLSPDTQRPSLRFWQIRPFSLMESIYFRLASHSSVQKYNEPPHNHYWEEK